MISRMHILHLLYTNQQYPSSYLSTSSGKRAGMSRLETIQAELELARIENQCPRTENLRLQEGVSQANAKAECEWERLMT